MSRKFKAVKVAKNVIATGLPLALLETFGWIENPTYKVIAVSGVAALIGFGYWTYNNQT